MFRKGLGRSIPPGEEAVYDGIGMDGFSADRCPLPPALDLIRRFVRCLEVGATRGFHDVVADRFTAELAAFEPRADGDFCDALFASAHGVDGKVHDRAWDTGDAVNGAEGGIAGPLRRRGIVKDLSLFFEFHGSR